MVWHDVRSCRYQFHFGGFKKSTFVSTLENAPSFAASAIAFGLKLSGAKCPFVSKLLISCTKLFCWGISKFRFVNPPSITISIFPAKTSQRSGSSNSIPLISFGLKLPMKKLSECSSKNISNRNASALLFKFVTRDSETLSEKTCAACPAHDSSANCFASPIVKSIRCPFPFFGNLKPASNNHVGKFLGRFSKFSTGSNGRTMTVALAEKAYIGLFCQLFALTLLISYAVQPASAISIQIPTITNHSPHVFAEFQNRIDLKVLNHFFSANNSSTNPTTTIPPPIEAKITGQKYDWLAMLPIAIPSLTIAFVVFAFIYWLIEKRDGRY